MTNSKNTYKPARPFEFVTDSEGNLWICDKGVDKNDSLVGQACWRYDDLAFTRND